MHECRYMTGVPCFIAIELDISDSGREGCAVSTLTITSEPKDWKEAVAVGVQEARRMQVQLTCMLNPTYLQNPTRTLNPKRYLCSAMVLLTASSCATVRQFCAHVPNPKL